LITFSKQVAHAFSTRPKQLVSKAELRLWRLIYTCLELQNLVVIF